MKIKILLKKEIVVFFFFFSNYIFFSIFNFNFVDVEKLMNGSRILEILWLAGTYCLKMVISGRKQFLEI